MNRTILITTMVVAATLFAAVAIAQDNESVFENGDAEADHGTSGQTVGHENRNRTGERSLHGLCNAWNANEDGRANGNASQAPPFVGLQERAEENGTGVALFCEQVPHPGDGSGRAHDVPRGPPADRGGGNGSAQAAEAGAENGQGNNTGSGKGQGNGNGNGSAQGNNPGDNGSGDEEAKEEEDEEEDDEEDDDEDEEEDDDEDEQEDDEEDE